MTDTKTIRLEFNDQVRDTMTALCVPILVGVFLYLVIVVWWLGLIEVWHKEEMMKYETCYQTEYYSRHAGRVLMTNYCTGSKGVEQ